MWLADPSILDDPEVPKGIKLYFETYAETKRVLGRDVLIVSQRLGWTWEDAVQYDDKQLGVGPSHTVDQRRFQELMPTKIDRRPGAPPERYRVSLGAWIEEHTKHGGKKFSVLYEVGERRRDTYGDD